jgi:hypothetical protein
LQLKKAIFLSKEAKSSIHQSAVFNYVNDYRNWADFGSWTTEDPEMKIVYPQVTVGKESILFLGRKDGPEMRTLLSKKMTV